MPPPSSLSASPSPSRSGPAFHTSQKTGNSFGNSDWGRQKTEYGIQKSEDRIQELQEFRKDESKSAARTGALRLASVNKLLRGLDASPPVPAAANIGSFRENHHSCNIRTPDFFLLSSEFCLL